MSSQDAAIPLTHAPDGRGYRLMELPPELEALLTAEDAPVITLTSTPASALLKTPDKTYKLLQKNTSNSLILLTPHSSAPSASEMPTHGLGAIATIHENTELVAQTEPQTISNLKNTGSKGKWHEKFGRGRLIPSGVAIIVVIFIAAVLLVAVVVDILRACIRRQILNGREGVCFFFIINVLLARISCMKTPDTAPIRFATDQKT